MLAELEAMKGLTTNVVVILFSIFCMTSKQKCEVGFPFRKNHSMYSLSIFDIRAKGMHIKNIKNDIFCQGVLSANFMRGS